MIDDLENKNKWEDFKRRFVSNVTPNELVLFAAFIFIEVLFMISFFNGLDRLLST